MVGGVTMANCPIVNETVYEVAPTGVRLAKTTCWLENLPLGDTTIAAGSSCPLDFKVIEGTVTTIETFDQFDAAMEDPVPGTIFLLKDFTTTLSQDGRTNGGSHTLWMREDEHDASQDNPIGLIGYPGAPAKFVVDSDFSNG